VMYGLLRWLTFKPVSCNNFMFMNHDLIGRVDVHEEESLCNLSATRTSVSPHLYNVKLLWILTLLEHWKHPDLSPISICVCFSIINSLLCVAAEHIKSASLSTYHFFFSRKVTAKAKTKSVSPRSRERKSTQVWGVFVYEVTTRDREVASHSQAYG
jgi:hypothetical protein